MGKAFEFYALYASKDYEGLIKLSLESVFGSAKGDLAYSEISPILAKYF
jgi:hypothetical protein